MNATMFYAACECKLLECCLENNTSPLSERQRWHRLHSEVWHWTAIESQTGCNPKPCCQVSFVTYSPQITLITVLMITHMKQHFYIRNPLCMQEYKLITLKKDVLEESILVKLSTQQGSIMKRQQSNGIHCSTAGRTASFEKHFTMTNQ
jgi:hypothetical protein